MMVHRLFVIFLVNFLFFLTVCKGFVIISADYAYQDENGDLKFDRYPPMRFDKSKGLLGILFRKKRQIPGMMPQDLQGINQMVRFKPYRFSGRRRMNPELLFPGAVIGDGVSHPIGTFNGIGYVGEGDLAGMAPTIYDRLPMPNLFQISYAGLNPEAAAAAAAAD